LGLETARQALAVAEQRIPHLSVYSLAVLLQLHLLKGDLAGAELVMAKIQANRSKILTVYEALAYLTEVEWALGRGNYEEVLVLTETSVKLFHRLKMRSYQPRLLDIRGQALLTLGQPEEAVACWQEARQSAEALGAQMRLWPVLLALSQLETNPAEARRLRQQAQEIVRYIADHIDPLELQESFLNLPQVKAALAE
jgi:ATP/maltotriose-dependent transcriptional regulator MalT